MNQAQRPPSSQLDALQECCCMCRSSSMALQSSCLSAWCLPSSPRPLSPPRKGGGKPNSRADDDFQHHAYPTSYPSAPTDNEPYNPGYYDRQESSVALPRTGYHGGVGVYSAGPIAGSAPPAAHMPLLHQAPPSYNEVVYRK